MAEIEISPNLISGKSSIFIQVQFNPVNESPKSLQSLLFEDLSGSRSQNVVPLRWLSQGVQPTFISQDIIRKKKNSKNSDEGESDERTFSSGFFGDSRRPISNTSDYVCYRNPVLRIISHAFNFFFCHYRSAHFDVSIHPSRIEVTLYFADATTSLPHANL